MIRALDQMAGPTTPKTKSSKPQALPALQASTVWRHRDEILARIEASGQKDALGGWKETQTLLKMHALADRLYKDCAEMACQADANPTAQGAHLDRSVREACLAEELQARICWHLRRLCMYHGITILNEKEGE